MSEVKRYGCNGSSSVFEDENGSLVDYGDYAALESKCAALAEENARLKSAVTQQIELRAEIKKAGRPPHADFWVQSICEAEEKVNRALEETPATDAFLAEVRAQVVDAAIEHLINKFQSTGHIGVPVMALEHFADQLRKGGNQ